MRKLWRRDRRSTAVAVGQGALFVAFAAGVCSIRRRSGASRWLKPAKFAGSLAGLAATLAMAWLAVRVWRGTFTGAPAFAAGIRLWLAVFVLASVEGVVMTGLGAETVVAGPSVPPLGRTYAGDFRAPHFPGLHALRFLPLVGVVAARSRQRGLVADGRRIGRPVGVALLAAFVATLGVAIAPLI